MSPASPELEGRKLPLSAVAIIPARLGSTRLSRKMLLRETGQYLFEHTVRNPLAGMKGALEVLRKELAVKPSNLEIVDELLAQIVRLEQLVRDLLTFARPRALSLELFDLHELLDRILRTYKEEADRLRLSRRKRPNKSEEDDTVPDDTDTVSDDTDTTADTSGDTSTNDTAGDTPGGASPPGNGTAGDVPPGGGPPNNATPDGGDALPGETPEKSATFPNPPDGQALA